MTKALLVGINSYPPNNMLNGCANDVISLSSFLEINCGFAGTNIKCLYNEAATQEAILGELSWLTTGLAEGDRCLFYFSGHGVRTVVRDMATRTRVVFDGICPIDFDWISQKHAIYDTDFRVIFCAVPDGVEFVWISDSCFSGGLFNKQLPTTEFIKNLIPANAVGNTIDEIAAQAGEMNVAFIAASAEDQESKEDFLGGEYCGAFTHFLLQALGAASGLARPLIDVITGLNAALTFYGQTPQVYGNSTIYNKPFMYNNFPA